MYDIVISSGGTTAQKDKMKEKEMAKVFMYTAAGILGASISMAVLLVIDVLKSL